MTRDPVSWDYMHAGAMAAAVAGISHKGAMTSRGQHAGLLLITVGSQQQTSTTCFAGDGG